MASSSSPAWRLISFPVPTVPPVAMTELGVTERTVVRITERVPLPRLGPGSLSTAADITNQGPVAAADIGRHGPAGTERPAAAFGSLASVPEHSCRSEE